MKTTGGRLEMLVERLLGEQRFLAQVRASKALQPGARCLLTATGTTTDVLGQLTLQQRRGDLFEFTTDGEPVLALLNRLGHMPLPPYIDRHDEAMDQERYQTVFARREGAVAAPTAGLHFSDAFLDACRSKGVATGYLTLHVGAGTFQPVRVDDIRNHAMHSEWLEVDQTLCDQVASTRAAGGRVVAVGTTVVRSLETAAAAAGCSLFLERATSLSIPGTASAVLTPW